MSENRMKLEKAEYNARLTMEMKQIMASNALAESSEAEAKWEDALHSLRAYDAAHSEEVEG